jgi:hypothetical protein
MAADHYAMSELAQETWGARMARVSHEIRDLVAATHKMIKDSRERMRDADRALSQR